MTIEAKFKQPGIHPDYTAVVAMTAGQVIQLADGRAAVVNDDIAAGKIGAVRVEGHYVMQKTASIALLDGGRAYWDHSANTVTFKPVNDRDFYVGTVVGDAVAADTTVVVNLNVKPVYEIELGVGEWTVADTLGLGTLKKIGGQAYRMEFDATAEAALASLLSDRSFLVTANAIAEFEIAVVGNGDSAVLDINVGVANAGHATDGDTITESCFVHIDGTSLNILAESDDGTTEVSATDTTVDYVEGTAFQVWFDLRDPSDVQIYIDGVLVLSGTTFDLSAATGPLKALIHMEKTSDDTVAILDAIFARVRTAEQ